MLWFDCSHCGVAGKSLCLEHLRSLIVSVCHTLHAQRKQVLQHHDKLWLQLQPQH